MTQPLPACSWCGKPFTTPEGRDRHMPTCKERPAATGRPRRKPKGPR